MDTCETCRFFEPHDTPQDNETEGACRRAPPAMQGQMDLEALPVYWKCAAWPETFADDWCGEWMASQDDQAGQTCENEK